MSLFDRYLCAFFSCPVVKDLSVSGCVVGVFVPVCVVHFYGVYLFIVINEILSEI